MSRRKKSKTIYIVVLEQKERTSLLREVLKALIVALVTATVNALFKW